MKVTADVRQGTLGYFGQRMIESVLRHDLGVPSNAKGGRRENRHLLIYDIADRRPPSRSTRMGDVRLTWIRTLKGEALRLISEEAIKLDKIRPRDPDARRKAREITECTEAQLRQRASLLVKTHFDQPAPEPYEDLPAPGRFSKANALRAVGMLPDEALRKILLAVECLDEFGLILALESASMPIEQGTWRDGWSWPGAVERAVHMLEFQDHQAQVISDLMLVLHESRTRPDFVVLELERLGRIKVLRRAIIYEAKTGASKLTRNQEHAMLLCTMTQHLEYRVVHVAAEHLVPRAVQVNTFSSRPAEDL